ncbi:MAG: hypothetical protein ACLFTH_01255 [Candidatus Woesearchaeota archaeon]
MAILNFGFTKINVEKHKKPTNQVNIQSGLNIKDVKESDVVKGTKQRAFSIIFSFETKYEPDVGNIDLEGELLYLADEETATDIENTWKEKKSLPKDIALKIFNKILHHCNVEALILSKEINLPPPIQMPKIKDQQGGQDKGEQEKKTAQKHGADKNTAKKQGADKQEADKK